MPNNHPSLELQNTISLQNITNTASALTRMAAEKICAMPKLESIQHKFNERGGLFSSNVSAPAVQNNPTPLFGGVEPIFVVAAGHNFVVLKKSDGLHLGHRINPNDKTTGSQARQPLNNSNTFILSSSSPWMPVKQHITPTTAKNLLASLANVIQIAAPTLNQQHILNINNGDFHIPHALMTAYFYEHQNIYRAVDDFMNLTHKNKNYKEVTEQLYSKLGSAGSGMRALILDYAVDLIVQLDAVDGGYEDAGALKLLSLLFSPSFSTAHLTKKTYNILYATLKKLIDKSYLEDCSDAMSMTKETAIKLGNLRNAERLDVQSIPIQIILLEHIKSHPQGLDSLSK